MEIGFLGKTRTPLIFRCFTTDAWPVLVAGNLPELGSWDPACAPPLTLVAADGGRQEWVRHVQVPKGAAIAFKFVKRTDKGPLWETGENRLCASAIAAGILADRFRA